MPFQVKYAWILFIENVRKSVFREKRMAAGPQKKIDIRAHIALEVGAELMPTSQVLFPVYHMAS